MAMMEMSSPLASLNHRPEHNWLQPTPLSFCPRSPFSPNMEMDISQDGSFFDITMEMTNSPTDCLAADLSQNFHIDKTPAAPTPRRSLFTAFGNVQPRSRLGAKTPPLPSSPADIDNSMDMSSPLPHKPSSFSRNQGSKLKTVSPIEESPCQMQRRPSNERKKSIPMRRPSLQRAKALSTNLILKTAGASRMAFTGLNQNKPFSFGSGTIGATSILTTDEMFDASPEAKPSGLGIDLSNMIKPRMATFLDRDSSSSNSDSNGSPLPASRRPVQRGNPRKQACRRTMSMFDKPEEVISPKMKSVPVVCAQSPSQVAARESQVLPCFSVQKDTLKRITRETMVDVLDGKFASGYDELKIVDCRFEYEYNGGHIAGAININNLEDVNKVLLPFEAADKPLPKKTLLIFHCEYSAHRAPRIANHLRSQDRSVNMQRYPELHYPEVYILEGGYRNFFAEYKERCEPQCYIEMDDTKHKERCDREMGKFRKNTKFGRTQSYTYGAGPLNATNSPTIRRNTTLGTNFAFNGVLGRPRGIADGKRMASY